MNAILRRLCVLLFSTLLLGCICGIAMAEEWIDASRDCSLTVRYSLNSQPISGVKIGVYYLASVDAGVNFTLTEKFSSYPVELENKTSEGWRELALALKGYVLSDMLETDALGQTDSNGNLRFSELKPGLYLLIGEKTQYNMEPTIVSLPANVDHNWVYDVTVLPKLTEAVPVSDIRVIKAWDDAGYESKRPAQVKIQLFQNDALYDTAALGKENDWSYRWQDLPTTDADGNAIEWSVAELPVDNYRVRIRQEGKNFVVTNYYSGSVAPNPPLPQTGQPWVAVFVLSFLGLCCIAVGEVISRRRRSR